MRYLCGCLLLIHLFLACNNVHQKPEIIIREDTLSGKICISAVLSAAEIHELKECGARSFALFLLDQGKPLQSSVACDYQFAGDSLLVCPVFAPGRNLDFEFQLFMHSDTVRKRFSTAQAPVLKALQLEHIFPLGDSIPQNILMFHVLFSEPMLQDRKAYEHVQLLDEKGVSRGRVWREKSHWAQDGKHLVLMIHPGRIKQGIMFKEEEGPLFEPGKKYTLRIGRNLKDRQGRGLNQDYTKTFFITGADRQIPSSLFNARHPLKRNSREPLSLIFSEPLDYGSMLIGVRVTNGKGEPVKGKIRCKSDRHFLFEPDSNWVETEYSLELNDYVADLANNRLHRRFEEKSLQEITHRPIKKYRCITE